MYPVRPILHPRRAALAAAAEPSLMPVPRGARVAAALAALLSALASAAGAQPATAPPATAPPTPAELTLPIGHTTPVTSVRLATLAGGVGQQ
jgi:hypothetical protein